MLALRLTHSTHPAVQARRLLVAAASAGTGFLLLCTMGYALSHPGAAGPSLLRLAWCTLPLAATVYFATAVARTDPGTRPRPGLAAIGLGPTRLMAVSATTTALSTLLGSMLALLVFLHLRGDLTGMPFDGAASEFLAADQPLPLPAALTLLSLVPVIASVSVALTLRPRDARPAGRAAAGAVGRFGPRGRSARPAGSRASPSVSKDWAVPPGAAPVPAREGSPSAPGRVTDPRATPADGTAQAPAPRPNPTDLPWGMATLAAGLAAEAYAGRTPLTPDLTMPGGLPSGPATVLLGWTLTALGLALAGPDLTHLCGRLLQAVRPGPLRLLAGRALMAEASRIGRPLGVVCAVVSGAYTMSVLNDPAGTAFGPLTTLGALVVAGCTLATLLTAAVEARQARAEVTAALVRLGAPTTMLRGAAALRAAALLALFAPLTLAVARLAALPLTG